MTLSRREFVQRGGWLVAAGAVRQDTTSRRQAGDTGVAADALIRPVGRPAAPVVPMDNDPGVIAIERKLRCTCGCTLDVYTCRTTDFSCTYSPAMHRDVVAQVQAGSTPDQIIANFVAKDGPAVLMAPPARGFNLAGYLLPGVAMVVAGLALIAWLMRRRPPPATAPAGSPGLAAPPDGAQLEALRRALDDVDA